MATHLRTVRDAAARGRSSVAAELEAIFAPLPRIASAAETATAARPQQAGGRRARLWLALLGAVVLAALIASLVLLRPALRRAPSREVTRAAVAPVAKPPSRDAIVAASPPTEPQVVAPPARLPDARVPDARLPGARAPDARPKAPPRQVRASRRELVRSAHHGGCPRFATEAWCLHGTIMAADDRLRDAYQGAVRAGVDHDTLLDVRSDWRRLRGRANRDPQALIRGYALLTQELRAESARARR